MTYSIGLPIDIDMLKRDNETMRAALYKIAQQKLSSEMEQEECEWADWIDGYDTIVGIARQIIPPSISFRTHSSSMERYRVCADGLCIYWIEDWAPDHIEGNRTTIFAGVGATLKQVRDYLKQQEQTHVSTKL